MPRGADGMGPGGGAAASCLVGRLSLCPVEGADTLVPAGRGQTDAPDAASETSAVKTGIHVMSKTLSMCLVLRDT